VVSLSINIGNIANIKYTSSAMYRMYIMKIVYYVTLKISRLEQKSDRHDIIHGKDQCFVKLRLLKKCSNMGIKIYNNMPSNLKYL
jgi:hypothetical protein